MGQKTKSGKHSEEKLDTLGEETHGRQFVKYYCQKFATSTSDSISPLSSDAPI